MNRTRYIFRGLFLFLTVSLLLYLNKKTDDNVATIAEFKFETLVNIEADSLDPRSESDFTVDETTRFTGQIIEDSSHVREGINYLIGILGLFTIVELVFAMVAKRKSVEKTQS